MEAIYPNIQNGSYFLKRNEYNSFSHILLIPELKYLHIKTVNAYSKALIKYGICT